MTMKGFWHLHYIRCLSWCSMSFTFFVTAAKVIPRAATDCSLIQRCSGTKRKKKIDDQKGFFAASPTFLIVGLYVSQLHPLSCEILQRPIHIINQQLVCSPFGQTVKPSGYHRATEPVWIQGAIGALQPLTVFPGSESV